MIDDCSEGASLKETPQSATHSSTIRGFSMQSPDYIRNAEDTLQDMSQSLDEQRNERELHAVEWLHIVRHAAVQAI